MVSKPLKESAQKEKCTGHNDDSHGTVETAVQAMKMGLLITW